MILRKLKVCGSYLVLADLHCPWVLKAWYRALATESILTSIIFPPSTGTSNSKWPCGDGTVCSSNTSVWYCRRFARCYMETNWANGTWDPPCYFLQGHVNLQLGQNNKLNLFFYHQKLHIYIEIPEYLLIYSTDVCLALIFFFLSFSFVFNFTSWTFKVPINSMIVLLAKGLTYFIFNICWWHRHVPDGTQVSPFALCYHHLSLWSLTKSFWLTSISRNHLSCPLFLFPTADALFQNLIIFFLS